MSPKKQKSKPQVLETSDEVVSVNAEYNETRRGWITVIHNKLGDALLTAAPLTVAQGGYIAALDPNVIKTFANKACDITKGECVTAGCNLMAFDHHDNQSPHVPISKKRVQDLKNIISDSRAMPIHLRHCYQLA